MIGLEWIDPLTRKELQSLSRRWPTYLVRGAYVGVVGLCVLLFWSSMVKRTGHFSPSEYAELGRRIFHVFVSLQGILVTTGAALTASTLVWREAELGTLGLLFLTPLSGREIALGKWKAAMMQSATLILAGLPVLAVCAYLGALEVWELLRVTALTAALAALGASLALRQAALRKSAAASVLGALAQLFLSSLLPLFFAFMIPGIEAVLVCIHPVFALFESSTRLSRNLVQYGWIFAASLSFVASLEILRSAGKLLLDFGQRVAEPDPELTLEQGLLAAGAAVRPWITETAVWDRHPLLWKEIATRPGARWESRFHQTWIWITLGLLWLAWLATHGRSNAFLLLLQTPVLTFILLLGGGLFIRDRESRRHELILSTPVSSLEILMAKLLAGLLAPESLFALGFGIVAILGWTLKSGLLDALLALLAAAFFLTFAYLLACLASLFARSVRGAFLFTGTLMGLLFLVLPTDTGWSDWNSMLLGFPSLAIRSYLSCLNPTLFLRSEGAASSVWPLFPAFCATYFAASALLLEAMVIRLRQIRCRH